MPRRRDISSASRYQRLVALAAFSAVLLALIFPATPTFAAPQLWLPTPSGETWRVVQGYACGTHDDWDRYSLDLVNTTGVTRGAPVRAAADGTIWDWVTGSGTLLIKHGDGFYTMYTHMERPVTSVRDTFVARGSVIGAVGDRGAPGTPHLHFTAFTGEGLGARQNRRSLPLAFADGYDLKELGGCNQHGGATLTASGQPVPWRVPAKTFVPLVVGPAPSAPPPPRAARIPARWWPMLCEQPRDIRGRAAMC
ncbi:MAG TPA: M23 family metallopeptidase [Roseiflexaceae bacterium]|nr:M23 family metallopeptidase [Roseiflexaceae bacterium]